ncbi:MucBP domain-containing protein [Enterococcus mundtii]|uniref:MucBP domain-containing protein n=1 Tax=Enterococcus mundtii TaxID=53346 RepID=UPI0018E259C1|nr:MucBP domain-containing protein [Enterococcus mundtii]
MSFSIDIPTYVLVADRGDWIPTLTGGKSGNVFVPNYFYKEMRYGKAPNLTGDFSIGEVTASNLPSGVTISRVVGSTTGNFTKVDVTVTRTQVSDINGHTNSINLNLSSLYLDTWASETPNSNSPGQSPMNVGGITLTNLNLGTLSLRTKNSIRVRYIDEAGNDLQEQLVEQMEVGQNYAYTPPAIPGYTYSKLSPGSVSASGQMVAGSERLVEFVYTKNPTVGGAITVNHEFIGDPTKNTSERFTDVGNVGDRFDLTPRTEVGWQVKGELPQVTVTEQAQTVTIQYERQTGGTITVNHEFIGEPTMNSSERITDVGYVGDRFDLKPRIEAGWRVKGELPQVTVTEQAQTVTIQYERQTGGAITVNHEFIGDPTMNSSERITDVGYVGDRFDLKPRIEAGWRVKGELPQVTVTEQAQTVTIQYERQTGGAITVNHEFIGDPTMNSSERITDVGYVGDRFDLKPRIEAGWRVKGELPQVTVTEQAQTVTIQYERQTGGAITVNHEFIDEPSLDTSEIFTDVGYVGDRFDLKPRIEAGWRVKGELPQVTVTEQAQTVKRYDLKMDASFKDSDFYGRFKQHQTQSELALGNFIENWKENQGYYRDTHSVFENIHELKETIIKNHSLEKYSMKVITKQNELTELQSKKQRINFFSKYIFNRAKYRQLKNQISELKNDLNIAQKARLLAMKGDYSKAEALFNVSDRTGTSHEVKQRRLTQKTLTPSLATNIAGPSKLQNKMEASVNKSAEIMQRKSSEKLRSSSPKEQRA